MPEISIVIVSLVGGDDLSTQLESVSSLTAECLVLLDSDNNDITALRQQFATVTFIDSKKLSVPMARQHGVELASGEVVALLEDTSVPQAGWFDAIKTAFSDSAIVALGGPVVLSATLAGRYLALGCGEYGRFHPDQFPLMAEGEAINGLTAVARLPGNNLAYRRDALMRILHDSQHGLIEGDVNAQLKADGFKLALHPQMTVTYCMQDKHGARLKTRFNHGRLYAGNCSAGQDWKTRISGLVKSMLLPLVLSLRGWSAMTHAVNRAAWPQVMLWIFLMETSWAIGEAVGYLSGTGDSLEAWH